MDKQETCISEANRGEAILRAGRPMKPIDSQELLQIAKRIDQFITDNGWDWYTMRRVYEILVACHG